jgi:hypothetical protein
VNGATQDTTETTGTQWPRYECHKKVWALKIHSISTMDPDDNSRLVYFQGTCFPPILCPGAMFARYIPVEGDYLVVYEDGYKSFSPKQAFEEGYTLLPTYQSS